MCEGLRTCSVYQYMCVLLMLLLYLTFIRNTSVGGKI